MVLKYCKKCVSTLGNRLRACDVLTHQKDTYPTVVGGLASLAIFGLIAYYVTLILSPPTSETIVDVATGEVSDYDQLIDNSPLNTYTNVTMVQKKTGFTDRIADSTYYYLANQVKGAVTIGFDWSEKFNSAVADYGFWQYNSGWNYQWAAMCGSSYFYLSDWTSGSSRGTDSGYVCPYYYNFYLKGQTYDWPHAFGQLELTSCWSGCDSAADMALAINDKTALIHMSSGYYDHDADPSDPIKTRQEDTLKITTWYDYTHSWEYFIKKNEVRYVNGTIEDFYSIDKINYVRFDTTYQIHIINIHLSSEYDIYEQYEVIQPVRRNLVTNTTTNTKTNSTDTAKQSEFTDTYYYLYIAAQMGGIFAIGQLVLSIIVGVLTRKMFLFD
jgi:hypothetical protein